MSSRFLSHTITGSFESKGFRVRNATSSDLPIELLELGRIVAKKTGQIIVSIMGGRIPYSLFHVLLSIR